MACKLLREKNLVKTRKFLSFGIFAFLHFELYKAVTIEIKQIKVN